MRIARERVHSWPPGCDALRRIRDDKSAATFTDLIGDYAGTIVCDAVATHGAGTRARPHIVLAGCWAHYPERAVISRGSPNRPQMARVADGQQDRSR